MARLKPVARADASPEVQKVYDETFSPGRDPVAQPGTATGSPGDFWTVLAHVPDVLLHTRAFADDFVRSPHRVLSRTLREVVIVRAAFNVESKFEYSQHRKFLRVQGYPEEKADEIATWTCSTVFTPEERALLTLADELSLGGGRSQDRTYEELQRYFSDAAIVEAAYIAAQYVMFGLLCRSLRVEYDDIPERCVEVTPSERPPV